MEFLFSNYPPVKTKCMTFSDAFYSLMPQSTAMNIAVGYVSEDSLVELKRVVELNENIKNMNLIIGMHYYDLFTKLQYKAAIHLNDFLTENHLGEVRLVTAFRYHGKLYSYSNTSGPFAGIVGSNNLGSILDEGARTYESSILLDDKKSAKEMYNFIGRLSADASKDISEIEFEKFNTANPILLGHESVEQLNNEQIIDARLNLSDIKFEIPVKTEPKSNLNCYHGKGRENTSTHLVRPRHWYEVELIVPKNIRMMPNYPIGKPRGEGTTVFSVITDDGYEFKCQVNGSENGLWNKNLRSSGDLTILGKWIKGRLENDGVLSIGELVTDKTLKEYGRNTITMTKIKNSDKWYFDFGVKK
ncbi:MAG: NgoFVII family restriction endonuclease [Clostridiales bacterium]|nr:NgoFVII family restriction endonuclease [Clostridiales bacterium]